MKPQTSALFKVAASSHVGRRSNQEDDHFVVATETSAVIAVADGMGGHSSGEVASRIAIETVQQSWPFRLTSESLQRVATTANEKILRFAKSKSTEIDLGTTLVLLAVGEDRALLGHAGDSRAWLVRSEEVDVLTRDHSALQDAIDRGVVDEAEAQSSPYRHSIVRYLGSEEFPGLDDLELGHADGVGPGSIFLLTTDGAHETLTPADFLEQLSGTPNIETGLEHLVRLAYHRGSDDNMTIAALEWGRFPRSSVRAASPPPIVRSQSPHRTSIALLVALGAILLILLSLLIAL